jgi:hypothetical protein
MTTREPTPGDGNAAAPDERWTDAACRMLDESADDLDAATVSRLNRARHAALAASRTRRAPVWAWPALCAAVASAALAVLVWPVAQAPLETTPPGVIVAGDLELLAADAELALYEDLEFYAWLDTQQSSDG